MPHVAGSRLGPYEVIAPLGAGGMGEVYRARDPRLGREVAIKVLPAAVAGDAERLRRFAQEARAASALEHPNLLGVYELDVHDGAPFLVTELLVGETLRERLRRGPLPPRRAAELSAQAARGLAAAHDRGILHRDLKPENLFLTRDGRLKILDFGLAKLLGEDEPAPHAGPETVTVPATAAGALLGTAGYMSPEQARGAPVDARSDLFAFGIVLFEMLAAEAPFRRDSRVETLHAILHDEAPDLATRVPALPPALARIVERCLAKDPAARFHSAHDLAFALDALSGTSDAADAQPAGPRRERRSSRPLVWVSIAAAALVVAGVAAGIVAWRADGSRERQEGAVAPPLRAELMPPPLTPRSLGIALSPDGRSLAVVSPAVAGGKNQLWVRRLDEPAFHPLASTEQADAAYPFWAPDGASLGFFSEGKLRRVDVGGGPVEEICDAPAGRGGSWGADGTILFAPTGTGTVFRVPAAGGRPRPVTRLTRPHESHRFPAWLPGGRHFVFVAWATVDGRKVEELRLGSLDSLDTRQLVADSSNAAFAAPDELLFVRAGRLLAQRMDPTGWTTLGAPRPLGEGPMTLSRERGYAPFAVGADDTLVFRAQSPPFAQLVSFDAGGRALGNVGEAAPWRQPRLSPDGRRAVVYKSGPDARGDLWLLDLARGTATRLTFEPAIYWAAAWSPDGQRLAFTTDAAGPASIFLLALGANSRPTPLVTSDTNDYVESWSADGRELFYEHQDPSTLNDVWVVSPADGHRRGVLRSPFREQEAALSPAGPWLAFASFESGQSEVYVVPYPRVEDGKWQISSGGGNHPTWRADGRELYYGTPDGRLMAVPVGPGASFNTGTPRALLTLPGGAVEGELDYDAAADGSRFLVAVPVEQQAAPISLLVGWQRSLKSSLPK